MDKATKTNICILGRHGVRNPFYFHNETKVQKTCKRKNNVVLNRI